MKTNLLTSSDQQKHRQNSAEQKPELSYAVRQAQVQQRVDHTI